MKMEKITSELGLSLSTMKRMKKNNAPLFSILKIMVYVKESKIDKNDISYLKTVKNFGDTFLSNIDELNAFVENKVSHLYQYFYISVQMYIMKMSEKEINAFITFKKIMGAKK